MILSNIGEFEFIRRIKEQWSSGDLPDGVLGIGDDCAIFPMNDQFDGLITTDLLIEKVHFSEETVSMWDLGAKSMEVNISDIAAMGGRPLYATISIAVQSDRELLDIESFYKGLLHSARSHKVTLLGGDTSHSSDSMFLSVTVVGSVEKGKALLRSQALLNDLVCVSGSLGDSHIGLNWLLSGLKKNDVCSSSGDQFALKIDYCCERHSHPKARVSLGRALLEMGISHACIDLSDGLSTDLGHICCESKVGACIELDRLPMDRRTREMAGILGIDPIKAMTMGGEDYELLFTIAADRRDDLAHAEQISNTPLTVIGTITDAAGMIDYTLDGQSFDYNLSGYDHFRRFE